MSDQRLRELERAARGGDYTAKVAWLRERMRTDWPCEACAGKGFARSGPAFPRPNLRCLACAGTGKAFAWRLHLAYWCFDPAAWEAQDERLRTMDEHVVAWVTSGRGEWLDLLENHSQETHVRVAYAAALATLERRECWPACPHGDPCRSVQDEGATCYHKRHGVREGRRLCASCSLEDETLAAVEAWLLVGLGARAGWAVLCNRRGDECEDVNLSVACAAWATSGVGAWPRDTRLAVDLAALPIGAAGGPGREREVRLGPGVGVNAVIDTLQRDVVPWDLGLGDPVRARAEAAGRDYTQRLAPQPGAVALALDAERMGRERRPE